VIACCGFTTERTLHDLAILRGYPQFDGLAAVHERNVFVVDGNAYFSRPGPRLVDSLEILAHILHPHVFPLPPSVGFHKLTAEELGLKEAVAT
jgi:iron complex transport system substrate-binding protein